MATPFEEGDPRSKICIIGEAPGRYEMRGGRPFIGPSGAVLDHCLHNAGIIRRECYLVNVIDHQIPNVNAFLHSKKGLTLEAKPYVDTLKKRLVKSKANVFIPMGGLALAALTEHVQIMKWRGSILESTLLPGKKVIPTVHPAATLRGQYIWRYFIIQDLKKARLQSVSPNIELPVRNLIIDPTWQESTDFLRAIKANSKRVACDIELSNHQVSCISFAPSADLSMSIPFKYFHGKHRWSIEQEIEIMLLIQSILWDQNITKMGQNFIFDLTCLAQRNHIISRGPICDTMIAQAIMYPDFPMGLDFLCSIYTDEPYYKDEGKIWMLRTPTDDDYRRHWIYNARDSAVLHDIWDVMEPELDEGYRDTYNFTVNMFNPLEFMMIRGFKVNHNSLKQAGIDIGNKIDSLMLRLKEVSDYEFSPTSPKQCQEYFYEHKGIKPYVSRMTGKATTDDKALQRIFSRFHLEEARLCQEIRGLKKLKGTYLDVGIDEDGRLRSFYKPRGAKSGRLSSAQTIFGTGLNMQNLHPEFKHFLEAD